MTPRKQQVIALAVWVVIWVVLFWGARGYLKSIREAMGNPPDKGCTLWDFPCCQMPDYPGCPQQCTDPDLCPLPQGE